MSSAYGTLPITVTSAAPMLLPSPPKAGLVFGIDPDTLQLPNGSAVESISDIAGLHPAAAQATSTKRPTLVTNCLGTGRNGLLFDGTDDSLDLSGSALNITRNKTAISVFALFSRSDSAAAVRDVFSVNTATGGLRASIGSGSGAANQLRAGARRLDSEQGTFITRTDPALSNQLLKAGAFFDWGAGRLGLDLVAPNYNWQGNSVALLSSGSSSDTTSARSNIGSSGVSQYFQGHLLSLLVYEAPRSTALVESVHAFWNQRYGV